MKDYILFNLLVYGSALILSLVYGIVYYAFIKKKKEDAKITPARIVAGLLSASLVTSFVGNVKMLNDYDEKLTAYYYPNTVYIREAPPDDPNPYSFEGLFSHFIDGEELPEYDISTQEREDVKFTYFLAKNPEERIYPCFVIFVEYTGDVNPDNFYWGSVRFRWITNSEEDAPYTFSSGDYHSTRIMLVGNYDMTINSLSADIDYKIEKEGEVTLYGDTRFYVSLETSKIRLF